MSECDIAEEGLCIVGLLVNDRNGSVSRRRREECSVKNTGQDGRP